MPALQKMRKQFLFKTTFAFLAILLSCNKYEDPGILNPAPLYRTVLHPPPAHLQLDSFYKKYIDVEGIPLVSSLNTLDAVLYKAEEIMKIMFRNLPQSVKSHMISLKTRICIYGFNEQLYFIPEYKSLPDTLKNASALGATPSLPIATVGSWSLYCPGVPENCLECQEILTHELAHTIHLMGLKHIYPDFDSTLQRTFISARNKGLWNDAYPARNALEYWACGVQSWFNSSGVSVKVNGLTKYIKTRQNLKEYDPELYKLIEPFFTGENITTGCHK